MVHVVRLAMSGSNAYLLRGARTVLVDCGAEDQRDELQAALAQAGVAPETLSLLLLTHAHAGTAGNAAWLQREHGVPVAVHGADAPILAAGIDRAHRPTTPTAVLVAWLGTHRFEPAAPNVVLGHTSPLWRHGIGATVVHTPGHTIGSVSVVCPGGEAIVGDLVMGGWFGGRVRTHHPVRHYFAESPARTARSLALLERLGVARILPAIGGELAMAAVRAHIPVVREPDALGVAPARRRERRLAHVGDERTLRIC